MQCANDVTDCPIQFGDTRIVITFVDKPELILPKERMLTDLKEQGPAFLYELLNCEIPPAIDRLRIPVLETEEKAEEQIAGANLVVRFIMEECYVRQGRCVLFKDFVSKFHFWLQENNEDSFKWSNIKIGRSIPFSDKMPVKGRMGQGGKVCLGNLSFVDEPNLLFSYVKADERLVKK
jgi:hypothetical protein